MLDKMLVRSCIAIKRASSLRVPISMLGLVLQ